MSKATVIGAGLAGCEAAWTIANAGFEVDLWEMKPQKRSPAHHSDDFAELVCSNSLKAMRIESAAGLLKEEMRRLGSLTLACAGETGVSAGGALAVDRTLFAQLVTSKIKQHPGITVHTGEVTQLSTKNTIVATGPLTSDGLSAAIATLCGENHLSFYDAAAPIVEFASIDTSKTFFAARYDRGQADYINCPFSQEEYQHFYTQLIAAQGVELHSFETQGLTVYEGCMPIEVMAKRGADTIRYGPLKPKGLIDPKTGHRPWAVVQLRKENSAGTLYNLVGFQTNLKFPEQKRVFSLIPGLENAQFVRYGVMHRNTFIQSPKLLQATFAMRSHPSLYFAGQITGVEGYMESAASGILAGQNLARQLGGKPPLILPKNTMIGALAAYISDETVLNFQPMGANMGILPPLPEPIRGKADRYGALASMALASIETTLNGGTNL